MNIKLARVVEENWIDKFGELLEERLGIHLRDKDVPALERYFRRVTTMRGSPSLDEIYARLRSAPDVYGSHWQAFIEAIVNHESYFFRDKAHITLLRERLLPELIARNREVKRLKLWSAGCSRGEEPYTLLILLRELLVDYKSWDLTIIGTDIDQRALEQAREGRYSNWSLRNLNNEMRKRYFHKKGNAWLLSRNIKEGVRFELLNLKNASLPDPAHGFAEMDLILCRNVLIYLNEESISTIFQKLRCCLKPGGYLLTAHAEALKSRDEGLNPIFYPESIVLRAEKRTRGLYQDISSRIGQEKKLNLESLLEKLEQKKNSFASRAEVQTSTNFIRKIDKQDLTIKTGPGQESSDLTALFQQGKYHQVIAALGDKSLDKLGFEEGLLLARSRANIGDIEGAYKISQELIKRYPLESESYCLLAQLAEARGDFKQARELLEKVLYLEPENVCGYLSLANINEQEGNLTKALELRRMALQFLRKLPRDVKITSLDDYTVGDVIAFLEKSIDKLT